MNPCIVCAPNMTCPSGCAGLAKRFTKTDNTEGKMNKVYIVWMWDYRDEGESEREVVGIYNTKEKAEKQIEGNKRYWMDEVDVL